MAEDGGDVCHCSISATPLHGICGDPGGAVRGLVSVWEDLVAIDAEELAGGEDAE